MEECIIPLPACTSATTVVFAALTAPIFPGCTKPGDGDGCNQFEDPARRSSEGWTYQ